MIKEFLLKIKIKKAIRQLEKLENIEDLQNSLDEINFDIQQLRARLGKKEIEKYDAKTFEESENIKLEKSIYYRCKYCKELVLKSDKNHFKYHS